MNDRKEVKGEGNIIGVMERREGRLEESKGK